MTQTNAKTDVTLEIESLSYGPHGIGRHEGKVIMIPFSVPGDKVSARIMDAKANYGVGEIVELIHPSPRRQTPPCPYFSACGGCPWQHVHYEEQLVAKQKTVEDALRRIGKLDGFELRPIIASPQEYGYRRRVRLQSKAGTRLGFYRANTHSLVEIDSCLIADDEINSRLNLLRDWLRQLRTPMTELEVVSGDAPGEVVIVCNSNSEFMLEDEALCSQLLETSAGINGLILCGRDWRRSWGVPTINVTTEENVRLIIDGDVFTQVNSGGNRRILMELLEVGEFDPKDRVLELYCGAGNFTLSVARRVQEVTAIESHRVSIKNARLNSQNNGLANIRWIRADVSKALHEMSKHNERFTKIILNPPRAGAKGIDGDLGSLGAERILYVSCNPATLARDLSAWAKHGYKLRRVQPIDLFPHTFHVETLAEMTR